MATVVRIEDQLEIPLDVRSLAEFRAWALSDDFSERGRIDYVAGSIEVGMSPKDLHTHGSLKTELVRVMAQRVKETRAGDLFVDSTRISCPEGDVSAEPDIVFISHGSIDSGRVRMIAKAGSEPGRFIEIEGPADLIVEIVSDSSVTKDTERLPTAYFAAGVREFWLADARRQPVPFRIHRRGPNGFEPTTPDANGYQPSPVLAAAYRLDTRPHPRGHLVYDLLER